MRHSTSCTNIASPTMPVRSPGPGMRRIISCPALFTPAPGATVAQWTAADVAYAAAYVPVNKLLSCTVHHTFPMSLLEDDNDTPAVVACMMSPPEMSTTCDDEDDEDHPCKVSEATDIRRRRRSSSKPDDE